MLTIIDPDRLLKFTDTSVHLYSGNGTTKLGKACVMNWVNFLAGGEGSADTHPCVDKVIANFIIGLNDAEVFKEWRDELKPFAVRVLNTASTPKVTPLRAYMCVDWTVRTLVPRAFEQWAKFMPEYTNDAMTHANKLRLRAEIVNRKTAKSARAIILDAYVYATTESMTVTKEYKSSRSNAINATCHARSVSSLAYSTDVTAINTACLIASTAAIAASRIVRRTTEQAKREIWDESLTFLNKLIAITDSP